MPAPQAIRAFCNGGGWPSLQLHDLNRHIDAEIEAGRSPRLAMRYVHGLAFGGHTEAEAYEIIRDRDCAAYGTGFELWELCDLPQGRWFRSAWVRSRNGGPININLGKAKRIQFAKITAAADRKAKRMKADIDLFDRPIDLPWGAIRDRIHAASEPSDLRRVWPEELN